MHGQDRLCGDLKVDTLGCRSLLRMCGGGTSFIFLAERVVNLDEHLLLALVQVRVVKQRLGEFGALALLENSSLHVKRLSRDAQRLRDLLQDLR